MKIGINICAPSREVAKEWGDYHMAIALKKYLQRNGHEAVIQIMPEWYDDADRENDLALHLRGISRYKVSERHVNVMWNVSHPEMVSPDEYGDYDLVFVASRPYADKISPLVRTKVIPLLQCTDTDIFFPDYQEKYRSDLLYVGNSRGVERKIIKDLSPITFDLKVWGTGWEPFINKKYIQGNYSPNEKLRQLYSSCKILLNDHWDDMRENGFINNRIFDALASKAFVISDKVAGLDEIVPGGVVTYNDAHDLREKVAFYLENESLRREIAEKGYQCVTRSHTFNERTRNCLDHISRYKRCGPLNHEEIDISDELKRMEMEINYWKTAFRSKDAEGRKTRENFERSLSWRITGPLRKIHRLLLKTKKDL